jgi:hypothetical protein
MTKLEAWKEWSVIVHAERLSSQFTLDNSSHGKAFSFAWDAAQKAERNRICDMLLDMHAKEERHNYYGFIANIIKESA